MALLAERNYDTRREIYLYFVTGDFLTLHFKLSNYLVFFWKAFELTTQNQIENSTPHFNSLLSKGPEE